MESILAETKQTGVLILIFKWFCTVKEYLHSANDSNCVLNQLLKCRFVNYIMVFNVPRLLLLFQKTENYMIACKWHIQFHTQRNAWKAEGPHIMQELEFNGIKWYIIWFIQPHFQKLIIKCQYPTVLHDLVCQKKPALFAIALLISDSWFFGFSISIQCSASGNILKGQTATPLFNLVKFHKTYWASFLCLPHA